MPTKFCANQKAHRQRTKAHGANLMKLFNLLELVELNPDLSG